MVQEKPEMIQAALIGGVFLGVTSALPIVEWFNCACCALLIGGGILASFVYLRDYPVGSPSPTYGDGALLGLFAGLIGGIVWTVVAVPLAYFQLKFGMDMDDLAELDELLNDPEIPPFVQEFLSGILTEGVLSPLLIFIMFFSHLILAVVFSTVGGVIGFALFLPKTPAENRFPATPGPPPTIPPIENETDSKISGRNSTGQSGYPE